MLHTYFFKAYTSQILALVMFALVMSEDRISMQGRRKEIIGALRNLPSWYFSSNNFCTKFRAHFHPFKIAHVRCNVVLFSQKIPLLCGVFVKVEKIWISYLKFKIPFLKIWTPLNVRLSVDLIREVLELNDKVLEIAKEIYQEKSMLIMGRGFNFATCLEGALKIKVRLTVIIFCIYAFQRLVNNCWAGIHFD